MTTPLPSRLVPALLALVVVAPALAAVTPAPARATTLSREQNLTNPRGWSAVAGTDPGQLRDMAQRLPMSQSASGDQPWCDHKAAVESALTHDFGESKVAAGDQGTVLWGSTLLGTWTVLYERPDATSCVIASGIGFSDSANPGLFFNRAGLSG
jgi:hypothetical protein